MFQPHRNKAQRNFIDTLTSVQIIFDIFTMQSTIPVANPGFPIVESTPGGNNLLFGQISPKTAWKWMKKIGRGRGARSKFYYGDLPLNTKIANNYI